MVLNAPAFIVRGYDYCQSEIQFSACPTYIRKDTRADKDIARVRPSVTLSMAVARSSKVNTNLGSSSG